MKKTFALQAAGKDDARVRDKIRHELNKFAKRQRGRALPEGVFRWDLACRLGADEATARELPWAKVAGAIDELAAEGAENVWIEFNAVPVHRGPRTARGLVDF